LIDYQEKPLVGSYIAEGKAKGIDLSGCNFVDFVSSNPEQTKGSLEFVKKMMKQQADHGAMGKKCKKDPSGEFKEAVVQPVEAKPAGPVQKPPGDPPGPDCCNAGWCAPGICCFTTCDPNEVARAELWKEYAKQDPEGYHKEVERVKADAQAVHV
jgi:hypothetical protein